MTESTSAATILTAETVPHYLAENAEKIGVFPKDAEITAKAILGGNVNYAFCATEESTGRTIFVKQAPEFVAVFGPDGLPLTSKRMKQEIAVFEEWKCLLGEDDCARYLPKIYLFDTSMMVFVMEFLDGYTLLDHDLVDISADVSPSVGKSLGKFMGKTHAATHSSIVSAERFAELKTNFENRPMREIQLEYVFTKCYMEATEEQKAGLKVDEAFMKEVNDLKASYDGKSVAGDEKKEGVESVGENLSLCHGDLHPGSIMVKGDSVKVIDPEFTVYGPPGLDVGSLLSGYVLGAVHQSFSNNPKAVESISNGVSEIWASYAAEMKAGGISDELMVKIEAETVGFTVAEVCRTALEFAGGRKWLQFEDAEVKTKSRTAALSIVEKCMTKRHENGMALLVSCLDDL